MTLQFGDVVIVSFPFTSGSAVKRRPAVVVSSDAINAASLDVILVPITSQIQAPASAAALPLADWQSAGLLKPSIVKPNPFTFLQSRVVKKLGALSGADAAALRRFVASLFG